MDNNDGINKAYIPYGEEWVKEMMKFPKPLLITKLKIEYEKNAALQPSTLPLIDKGELEAIEFAEFVELEGYRINGMDDGQRAVIYRKFKISKMTSVEREAIGIFNEGDQG